MASSAANFSNFDSFDWNQCFLFIWNSKLSFKRIHDKTVFHILIIFAWLVRLFHCVDTNQRIVHLVVILSFKISVGSTRKPLRQVNELNRSTNTAYANELVRWRLHRHPVLEGALYRTKPKMARHHCDVGKLMHISRLFTLQLFSTTTGYNAYVQTN